MREIPLSGGLVALVDDVDVDLVLSFGKWSTYTSGKNTYGRRTIRDGQGGRETSLYMHRVIAGYPLVDHVNGNGLDNRRANLRPATHAGNMRNARRRSDNTSGYKGVSWDGRRSKWTARLQLNGRNLYLGLYVDPADAALAYDAAAIEHFGEFARLNFPQEMTA